MKPFTFIADIPHPRLDTFLAAKLDCSRSHAAKLIEGGNVTLNGTLVTKSAAFVKPHDTICVTLPDAAPLDIAAEALPLDIIYQDADLAVINKPQGLTVHPANNQSSGTLVNALLFHLSNLSGINGVARPGIVHRLDKDTSGLLVVAKNDTAHVALQRQIQTKACRRIYIALVEGVVKEGSGIIDQPLARSHTDRKQMAIDSSGRSAVTHFTVLARYRRNTLVQFELKTGRTHQIRVHTRYIGHPIVGDAKYGFKNQRFNLKGQLLHARELSFTHPTTGAPLTFTAPLPPHFTAILDKIECERIQ